MGKKIIQKTGFFLSYPNHLKREQFFIGGSFPNKKEGWIDLLIKKIFKISLNARIIVEHRNSHEDSVFSFDQDNDSDIQEIRVLKISHSYPHLFCVLIRYIDDKKTRVAKGSSLVSMEEAFKKAYGEYLERFIGLHSLHEGKNIPKLQPLRLKDTSLRMEQLPTPLPIQKIYNSYPHSNKHLEGMEAGWVQNTSKNRSELLPLSCLYYGVPLKIFLHQPTTNGSGGGLTLESARLSALYELIERDHFLLFWTAGIHPPIIDVSTMPNTFKGYVQYIEKRFKLKIFFLETTYETPVFSCNCIIMDTVSHTLAVGGSAGSDVLMVCEKAFIEALTELQQTKPTPWIPYRRETAFNNSLKQETRSNFYNSPEGFDFIEKIFLKGLLRNFGEIVPSYAVAPQPEQLQILIDHYREMSKNVSDAYNLYFYEYSGKKLEENGYIVSKAFIPGYYKLWLNEHLATPWSPRLQKFAQEHGKKVSSAFDLNYYPHPFA